MKTSTKHFNFSSVFFLIAAFFLLNCGDDLKEKSLDSGAGEQQLSYDESQDSQDGETVIEGDVYKFQGGRHSWTIRGTLRVRENETDPNGTYRERNLVSCEVKIEGSLIVEGGFVYLATVRTNSNGFFSYTLRNRAKLISHFQMFIS